MELLTANLGRVRREVLHGRDFYVANLSMIVPGVLPGSKGPLLYTEQDVSRHPDNWNGMPIVVNHPVGADGTPTSARIPAVLNDYQIGHVFGTKFAGRLSSEGWFDVELTRNADRRLPHANKILPRLERGEPIELSTGLYTRNEPVSNGATHNGVPYTHVARDYRPDHLAVLPDSQGACSLRDGCGVLVNSETKPKESGSNCGTGAGGFKPGNTCGGGGTAETGTAVNHADMYAEFGKKAAAATFNSPEYKSYKESEVAAYRSMDAEKAEASIPAAPSGHDISRLKMFHTDGEKAHDRAAKLAKKTNPDAVPYHKSMAEYHKARVTDLSGGVYRPSPKAYVRSDIGKKSRVRPVGNESVEGDDVDDFGVIVNGRDHGYDDSDVDDLLENMARNQPRDSQGRWTGGSGANTQGKKSKSADRHAERQAAEYHRQSNEARKSGDLKRAQGFGAAAFGYHRAAQLHSEGKHREARAVAALADDFASGKRKLKSAPKPVTNEAAEDFSAEYADVEAEFTANSGPGCQTSKAVEKCSCGKADPKDCDCDPAHEELGTEHKTSTTRGENANTTENAQARVPAGSSDGGQFAGSGGGGGAKRLTMTDVSKLTRGKSMDGATVGYQHLEKAGLKDTGSFMSSGTYGHTKEPPAVVVSALTSKGYKHVGTFHGNGYKFDIVKKKKTVLRVFEDSATGGSKVDGYVTNEADYGPTTNEDLDMARDADIAYLTTNCDCWRGKADSLRAIPDDQILANLRRQAEENAQLTLTVNTLAGGSARRTEGPKTAEQWYAEAPPEIQEVVRNAKAIQDGEKLKLVERIVQNNASTKAAQDAIRPTFAAMSLPTLQTLAANLPEPTANVADNPFSQLGLYVPQYARRGAAPAAKVNDYSGAAGGAATLAANAADDDEGGGLLPTINEMSWAN